MADRSLSNSRGVRFAQHRPSLVLSEHASRWRNVGAKLGHALLFLITCSSALAVLFIFIYIAKDALPFFQLRSVVEFLGATAWYPAADPPSFGAGAIFFGSLLVTVGAAVVAVPLGVAAAVCLSDILPFRLRQYAKPVIEVLAAIPSVAYGFFALVVFAPLLQAYGGALLAVGWVALMGPLLAAVTFVLSDVLASKHDDDAQYARRRVAYAAPMLLASMTLLALGAWGFAQLEVSSGANALNVSVILGIMALPTIVSVSEDALQAVGRELREGAYALGSTRSEMLIRVVIPAASSGIVAGVILGVMRAVGETMVVWMASGNAAQIPNPPFNFLQPVRTLTATIAGEMGEADHVTGSARYHVLFAMALALLTISFVLNLVSEWALHRSNAKFSR